MTHATAAAQIRARLDTDLPALARLLVEVHQRDGYPVEGVADPVAWLQSDQMLGAWVAELDGEVVGHVALTRPTGSDDAAKLWAQQTGANFDEIAVGGRLFVGDRGRGHHLGQQLTQTASDYARTIGRRAVLDVMAKDRTAIHIYERLGWTPLGPVTHTYGDGQTEPALAFVSPDPTARAAELTS